MKLKKCFKCLEEKPKRDFYRHPQMADGRLGKCKKCTKTDVRKHRRENDSVREYDRRRYHENPKRRAHAREVSEKWDRKYPHRAKAHNAVSNAIRAGRLIRLPCEECGSIHVHAHHDDYDKPLEVRWLCPMHHHRHHAKDK